MSNKMKLTLVTQENNDPVFIVKASSISVAKKKLFNYLKKSAWRFELISDLDDAFDFQLVNVI